MKAWTLNDVDMSKLLLRHRHPDSLPDELSLATLFREVLRLSGRFVPAESGSVLIDDPVLKLQQPRRPEQNELVFVACFGEKAEQLLGKRVRADQGIVGQTYQTGEAYISSDVTQDPNFSSDVDKVTGHHTQSIISVPIRVGASTCGVLELINHRDRVNFVNEELELLKMLAGYISTSLQNILDAKRYQEETKRDDLTGLANDRHFNHQLTEELKRADREHVDLCVIFLDLDHFKEVNDEYGHLTGSQTLQRIGLVLASAVGTERATVARYGGDEFVVVVPNADRRQALRLAESSRHRIETAVLVIQQGNDLAEPITIAGRITASIGVASYRDLDRNDRPLGTVKNDLIRRADQAMYLAKAAGKNRVCCLDDEP